MYIVYEDKHTKIQKMRKKCFIVIESGKRVLFIWRYKNHDTECTFHKKEKENVLNCTFDIISVCFCFFFKFKEKNPKFCTIARE